jgi:hypothetical protein
LSIDDGGIKCIFHAPNRTRPSVILVHNRCGYRKDYAPESR